MRVRLRGQTVPASPRPGQDAPAAIDRRLSHRQFLKAVLGTVGAAGLASAAPGAEASYVPGSPDRVDTGLDVAGALTVGGSVGIGLAGAAPAAPLHVRGAAATLDTPSGDVELRLARGGTLQWALASTGADGSFRLRASSAGGFDPGSVPGCQLWLRADALALGDGAPVGTWPDLSGAGHGLTQGAPARQPTLRTGVVNGLPVVRFDGLDDFLQSPQLNVAAGAYTLLYVARTLAPGGFVFSLSPGPGLTSEAFHDVVANGLLQSFAGLYSSSIPLGLAGAHAVVSLVKSGANATAYKNGVQTGSIADWKSFAADALFVGYRPRTQSYFHSGEVAELLLFNRELSAAERESLETYLLAKYGLSGALNQVSIVTALPSGSVGIGTTTPTARLDVNGSARVAGDLTLGAGLQVAGSLAVGIVGPAAARLVVGGAVGNTGAILGGRNALCAVQDPASLGFNAYLNAGWRALTGAQYTGAIQLDPGSGALIVFAGDAPAAAGGPATLTERLRVTNAGNVGIGTATPTARLEVNGDVRVTGSLRATGSITVNGVVAVDASGVAQKSYYAP